MSDERYIRECLDKYGCSDEEYNIHRYMYNRALFHNMMGFMDICCEIDIISSTIIMMHCSTDSAIIGKQYDYGSLIKDIAEKYVYCQDYSFFTWQMDMDNLKKLRQELEFNLHILGKTGLPETFKVILTPVMNEQSSVSCIYMSARNIEEDVLRARQMEKEKNAIFAAMSNSYLCIAYADITRNTCELFANELMAVTLPRHANYDRVYEFVYSRVLYEYRQIFEQNFSKAALNEHFKRSDDPIVIEVEQEYSDGRHWTEIKAVALPDRQEELLVVILLSVIDGRRKNEIETKAKLERINEHLRRCLSIEEQYRQAVISGAVMVYHVNLTLDIITDDLYETVGDDKVALLEEVGLSSPCSFDEFASLWAEKMVQPDDREEFMRIYNRKNLVDSFLMGKAEIVHEFQTKLGGENSVRILRQTILIVQGSEEGDIIALCNVKDVTQIRAEEYNTKKSLIDAYETARQANEAKSDFLSRMSHDIRTPMNAIMGMTTIARMHLDDRERVADCLRKIELSSTHLLGLLNEVLDMSKIESGNFTLTYETFDLVKLMHNLVEMSRAVVDEKHHELEVDIEELRHRVVVADSQRIQQVFVNLLGNAVKYTPEHGRIRISLCEKPSRMPKMGCYEMVFEDNGIGMTPEYMKYIFEPFLRAEDTRINKIEGTGLGLSISKNIVEMMDGTIEVESEVNKGSKFTVTVFLKLAEGRYEVSSNKDKKSGNNTLYEGSHLLYDGKNILLVEDNERNAEVAAELIGITGANVELAENGKEAVRSFSNSAEGYYSLIFMDIQMPVMNGYDAARAIRAIDRADAGRIPIIAMTANAFTDDVEAAMAAGMNEHIAKPLELDRLTEILKKWMG